MSTIEIIMGLVIGGIVYFGVVYLFFKRRNQKSQFSQVSGGDDIDYQALEDAEEAVKNMDLRKQLLEHYVFLKKFQSFHGHDQNSLTSMVNLLRTHGIEGDFYFDQSLPAGVASYTGATGAYELYVERDKEEAALALLRSNGLL